MNYIDRLKIAEKESLSLGLEPRLDLKSPSTGESIKVHSDFCSKALIHMLVERFGAGDWGQQCLNVAAKTFALLQHYQVPCELVYGEVKINGTNEFDTKIEGLKAELENGLSTGGFAVHVWINIGKDYIIDPTISSRIHKYYDKNCSQNMIINGKSNTLKKQRLEYIPMLVGAKFLDVTCGIPLQYQPQQ